MQKPSPEVTRKTVLTLAAVFSPLIWLLYTYLHKPTLITAGTKVPSVPGSILLSVVVAFGLAFLIGLAALNRKRGPAVFRPTKGKVLVAIPMAGLTPIMVTGWTPWLFGVLLFIGGIMLEPLALIFALIPIAIWYPISGLIISGITSRRMRVLAFSSLWFACYSTLVLVTGVIRWI